MSRKLNPDEEHEQLAFGRALHELTYLKNRKEVVLAGARLDILISKKKLVCEVKTSSRYLESAKFQLAYYLYGLREQGLNYSGELCIPLERKRFTVVLHSNLESRLVRVMAEIGKIISAERPEAPVKNRYCRKCAYKEFCWA
jgi:CRISPR-associated exonuclease Cas4